MSETNRKLSRRVFEALWNGRKPGLADELISPTHQNHDPSSPDVGRGPEGFRQIYNLYITAFPDLRFVIDSIITEGDMAAVRWTSTGTHRGRLHDIEPTGRHVTVTGTTVLRIENGQVQESWDQWDALGLLRQLGAVRPVGMAARQSPE